MRRPTIVFLAGVGLSTVALVLGMVALDKFIPARSVDLFGFALVLLGIVVTALTLMGILTFANTWNDIDTRTQSLMDRREAATKAAIDSAAEQATVALNDIERRVKRRDRTFQPLMIGLIAVMMVVYSLQQYPIIREKLRKR